MAESAGNRQTALLSLDVLARVLGRRHQGAFVGVLDDVTEMVTGEGPGALPGEIRHVCLSWSPVWRLFFPHVVDFSALVCHLFPSLSLPLPIFRVLCCHFVRCGRVRRRRNSSSPRQRFLSSGDSLRRLGRAGVPSPSALFPCDAPGARSPNNRIISCQRR